MEVSFAEKKARLVVDVDVTDDALLEAIGKVGPYSGKIKGSTPSRSDADASGR
ncbi:MAG: hypothetical protein Kow0089_07160 [Desulfobulbaceae bacterium]